MIHILGIAIGCGSVNVVLFIYDYLTTDDYNNKKISIQDVNEEIFNLTGKTNYILACKSGNIEFIKTIINKYSGDMTIRDTKGNRLGSSFYLNHNQCVDYEFYTWLFHEELRLL